MAGPNDELVALFRELVTLMILDEGGPGSFRVRAYENAMHELKAHRGDLSALTEKDLRRTMPRFQGGNFDANLAMLRDLDAIAGDKGCTMAQLALAWLLARGEDIIPIPGTKKVKYVEENAAAADIRLSADDCRRLEQAVNPAVVTGERYDQDFALTLDSEEE